MVLATPTSTSLGMHHRKRQGQHHKASKHYIKTYWPYLPMLLVVVTGFFINVRLDAGQQVLSYATSMNVTALLQETNLQRSEKGQPALSLNNQLSRAAQQKANDMAVRNYWSHISPEGTQPWEIITASGYTYTTAGENLAYGFDSSSSAVTGWMNSPPHRDNILKASYQDVGFGIANSADYQGRGAQTIVVAMYASPKKTAIVPAAQQEQPPVKNNEVRAPNPASPSQAVPAQPSSPATSVPTPPVPSPPTVEEVSSEPAHNAQASAQPLTSKQVARVDLLTAGNAEWGVMALTALVTICIIIFVYRHLRMWRRFLLRGERFVIRHPILDTVVVTVVMAGIILTGTSGFIH